MKLRLAKESHEYWIDAKHAAREASLEYGVAWIIGGGSEDSPFYIAFSDKVEDAPEGARHEFIDGIEQ